jgi:hypothetical protein
VTLESWHSWVGINSSIAIIVDHNPRTLVWLPLLLRYNLGLFVEEVFLLSSSPELDYALLSITLKVIYINKVVFELVELRPLLFLEGGNGLCCGRGVRLMPGLDRVVVL